MNEIYLLPLLPYTVILLGGNLILFTRYERLKNRYIMSFPGWAFKMTFWILLKVGKNRGMPIQNQLALGYIRIPKHK